MILRQTHLVKMQMEDDLAELDELRFRNLQAQSKFTKQSPISEIFGSLERIQLKRKPKPELTLQSGFSLHSLNDPVSEISSFQAIPPAPVQNHSSPTTRPNPTANQPSDSPPDNVVN